MHEEAPAPDEGGTETTPDEGGTESATSSIDYGGTPEEIAAAKEQAHADDVERLASESA